MCLSYSDSYDFLPIPQQPIMKAQSYCHQGRECQTGKKISLALHQAITTASRSTTGMDFGAGSKLMSMLKGPGRLAWLGLHSGMHTSYLKFSLALRSPGKETLDKKRHH